MRKNCLVLFLCALLPLLAQNMDDNSRMALNGALANTRAAMANAPFGKLQVAVLPIGNDLNNYVTERLKNIVTECGFDCVEGKDEPMWDEILREIAWNIRKDDILDARTLVRFGQLKAPQVLVYGKVSNLTRTSERVYAEIVLHATDVRTKSHIWGGSFAYRFYPADNVKGVIDLDMRMRQLLKNTFGKAEEDLKIKATNFRNIKTVTVIPLAGDVDHYMTNLAIAALTNAGLSPINPRIPTLSMAESAIRDKQLSSDAILYGAVRDLSIVKKETKFDWQKKTKSIHEICNADIQLTLQVTQAQTILWTGNITISEELEPRMIPLSQRELDDHQKEVLAQLEREKELDDYKKQQIRIRTIWELEKKLTETKNEAELQMLRKQIEIEIKKLDKMIIDIDAETAKSLKKFADAQTARQKSVNALIDEQAKAKEVQAAAFNRLVETQEQLKVIRDKTNITVTEIQREVQKVIKQINDIKNAQKIADKDTEKNINQIQNQMEKDNLAIEKTRRQLENDYIIAKQNIERREKNIELEIKRKTWNLEREITEWKQKLDQNTKEWGKKFDQQAAEWKQKLEQQAAMFQVKLDNAREDLAKSKDKRKIPWVVFYCLAGIIMLVFILSIIRWILTTMRVR